MSKLVIQQFAELGSEHFELHWLAGFTRNESGAWFVKTAIRGMSSLRFHMRLLPIGMLPLLTLGKVFANGQMLSLSSKGMIDTATISDMSQYEEVTSAEIHPSLYSFGDRPSGIQRLFRYSTANGEILIPAIELIRYLFLHNRTLANALMRPGALNLLFRPELPGYQSDLEVQFTVDMPKSYLSDQFAQEFAWLALDKDARHGWDSVYLQSQGEAYVTFTPPPLKNSKWTFRGVKYGDHWLVLELLHLTGKSSPCDKLSYGHPLLKKVIRESAGHAETEGNDEGRIGAQKEHIVYDYQLDDGQAGSKSNSLQRQADMHSKRSDFDRDITIEKLLIDTHKLGGAIQPVELAIQLVEKHQIIKVSAGEQACNAALPPLNFNLLTPASWDDLGDLEALTNTVYQMATKVPEAQFAMSLCQLKAGRAFSMANRIPRVALVVTIVMPNEPHIVLLDVERTGNVALSLMVLRFKCVPTFEVLELKVKLMLDGLINASGHWDHEVEKGLAEICHCERLPKMLMPRNSAGLPGRPLVWALKLLSRICVSAG